jgi:hypothetical protein
MTTAKAEATQILVGRESTAGTAPSSGWMQLQPNPGGITGWTPEYVDVNRDPLSTNATDEKGDHVGLNANPVIVHDLNKDLVDQFAEGWLRSVAKVPGDEPTTAIYRPTAVTSTGYTVAADGDLANGLLVYARGFDTSGNNGLKVLAGTSTGTEIKTTGLAAETPSGTVSVEVCGVQGGTADIGMNASGHLTSTTLDFTTLGLVADVSKVKVGGSTTVTQFATAACNCWATVDAISANLLTLKWHTETPAADAGTGKTIQLFFGRAYRNVALDHADYLEPSWHGEKEDQGVGAANAAVYTYAEGMHIGQVQIAMPLQSKVEVTTSFVGMDITDPVLVASRVAGPSAAYAPLATNLFDTANDMVSARVMDGSSEVIAEINSMNLTISHGVTPKNVLATFGAVGAIFGKIRPSASMEIYYNDSAIHTGIRANTTYRAEAILKNDQCAIAFDLPTVTLRGGAMSYAANSPVMVSLDLPAHRDPATNIVMIMNVFPYVP